MFKLRPASVGDVGGLLSAEAYKQNIAAQS
jgi:hypothetical protein